MNLSYLARRLAGALLTLLLATMLAGLLVHIVPGDAAEVIAGETATADQVQAVRQQLGTDQPIVQQYTSWLGKMVHGDFGKSLLDGRDVWGSLSRAAPVTLTIAMYALVLAVLMGVTLGVLGGVRPGSWRDRIAIGVATIGQSTPSFWVGLILVSFFALDHSIFPATGYVSMTENIATALHHATLPAFTLALGMTAELIRQTRTAVIEVMGRPYVMTAKSKGMSMGRVVRLHVLRNAAIPVTTVLGLQIGRLLGGAVVIEVVFGLPGLGSLAVKAVLRTDLPLIQAYVLMTAVIVVSVNLLVDISYGWLNPKVRHR